MDESRLTDRTLDAAVVHAEPTGKWAPWSPDELALLAEWYPKVGAQRTSAILAAHGYMRSLHACSAQVSRMRPKSEQPISRHMYRRKPRRLPELRACNATPCTPEMQEKFDALELLIMSAWRLAERQGLDVSLRDLVDTGLTLCQYQPSLLGGIISKQRRRSA